RARVALDPLREGRRRSKKSNCGSCGKSNAHINLLLFQRGLPVDDDVERRVFCVSSGEDEKFLPVGRDVVLMMNAATDDRAAAGDPGLKQRMRRTDFRIAAKRERHGHQRAVRSDVEELAAIAAPDGLYAAVG